MGPSRNNRSSVVGARFNAINNTAVEPRLIGSRGQPLWELMILFTPLHPPFLLRNFFPPFTQHPPHDDDDDEDEDEEDEDEDEEDEDARFYTYELAITDRKLWSRESKAIGFIERGKWEWGRGIFAASTIQQLNSSFESSRITSHHTTK
ncbi:hypothetical protein M0802_006750 [Mischocyttarus mexicanus]|nr:hypothetical protein M0802_006750 [Mischocyttarus mexicanus]